MAQQDKIRIKCFLGEEIRVLNVPKNISHEQLLQRLETDFGFTVQVAQYEDHEGDKVTVSSKSDLEEAFAVYDELRAINPTKIITLKLFLKQPSSSSSSSLSSSSAYHTPPPLFTQEPPHYVLPLPPSSPIPISPSPSSSSEPDRPSHPYSRTPPRDNKYSLSPPPSRYSDFSNDVMSSPTVSRKASSPPPLRTPPRSPPDSPRTPSDSNSDPNSSIHSISNNSNVTSTSTSSANGMNSYTTPPKHDFTAYMHPKDQPQLPLLRSSAPTPLEEDSLGQEIKPIASRATDLQHAHSQPIHQPLPQHPQQQQQQRSPLLFQQNNVEGVRTSPLPTLIMAEHNELQSTMPRWQKGQLIGRGGYGSVYLGLNQATGELFAVKQLELDNMDDPKYRAVVMTYAKEIEVMRSLNHENIVRYLGIQVDETNLNIFLEYMPGGSISALLNRFGPLSEPVIRVYTKQILTGLVYLHSNHIVHRDIKGANILADTKGNIKLADFGCSKIFAGIKSHFKTVLGTPFWMAPEVIKQTGHGRPADIWSLGCVIIEMSSGQPPFSQFSEVAAAMFHIASTTEPPEIPSHLSPEAHDFLLQCFQRDPKERPDAQTLLKHPFLRGSDQHIQSHTSPQPFVQELLENFGPLARPRRRSSVNAYFARSMLVSIPISITYIIIRMLTAEDIVHLGQVCKYFKTATEDDNVWRSLAAQHHWRRFSGNTPWRAIYIDSYTRRKTWLDGKYTSTNLKGHTRSILCLKLVDSQLFSGGNDKKVKAWDIKKGKMLYTLKGHTNPVTGIDADRECSTIYSCSSDQTIKIWQAKSKKVVKNITGHLDAVMSVALYGEDEGKLLSASLDKTVQMWDVESGSSITTFAGHSHGVYCVRYEGNTALSAAADRTLRLWDLRTSSCVRVLEGHTDEVTCCQIKQEVVISGGGDGTVREWEVGSGRCVQIFEGHNDWVWNVQFDQTKIVSCGKDKQIRLWDWNMNGCAKVLPGHQETVFGLQMNDQRIISAGKDRLIKVWVPEKLAQGGNSNGTAGTGGGGAPTTTTTTATTPTTTTTKIRKAASGFTFGFG